MEKEIIAKNDNPNVINWNLNEKNNGTIVKVLFGFTLIDWNSR